MDFTTIISVNDLFNKLDNPNWAIVDCRSYPSEPEQGYQEYLEGHIPGAIYAHLDRNLSGEIIPGKTSRHPLPDVQEFTDTLSTWGIDRQTQVIAYDNSGGAIAARLWWMLRWVGHGCAAVLNGGWSAWIERGYAQESQESFRSRRLFTPHLDPEIVVDTQFVNEIRLDPEYLLIDARAPERFWGLEEPIDSIAGHIPGAVSAPYSENLTEDGYFQPDEVLTERYRDLLGDYSSIKTILYCGSGVTAIHNIIAMVQVGYDMPLLYPGSWSEWITDPSRPIAP